MRKVCYVAIAIITAIAGCRKPYTPPVITSNASYLVVEGIINTGNDSTIIKLSRTVNISNTRANNPQLHAVVTVESDQNNSYPLTETTLGNYVSPGLNLDNSRQYRLRIKTPDNQQYISDFAAVKITPPIDSIGFTLTDNNVKIYANTHDPNNNTHYYQWDFIETWQFHPLYYSSYVTNGTAIVQRSQSQFVYTCFSNDASSNIIIASSAALSKDVIYQAPITIIDATSEKIEARYSILLRQHALSADAYNFWQNLKKNTEGLGSIFDAQPSTSVGNIHNIKNPDEIIVGYISVCTVQSKRIFISNGQLPGKWKPVYPYICSIDTELFAARKGTIANQVAYYLIPKGSEKIPIDAIYMGSQITGYSAADNGCVDCTIRGTTKIPSFW